MVAGEACAHATWDSTLPADARGTRTPRAPVQVMVDPQTGRSRGFGFVRFTNEAERDRAINEMNGVYIGSKPVRVSHATARPAAGSARGAPGGAPPYGAPGGFAGAPPPAAGAPVSAGAGAGPGGGGGGGGGEGDATNTTLFVGGLSPVVSEAELHAAFAQCGDITYTKIPPNKGCGFVQFVQRQAAEYALEQMNGYVLGGMPIRVSWGKSSRPGGSGAHAPSHHAASHAGAYGGAYAAYGASAYDPYGGAYGAAYAYDPAAYGAAGGYGAYGAAVAHDPAYAVRDSAPSVCSCGRQASSSSTSGSAEHAARLCMCVQGYGYGPAGTAQGAAAAGSGGAAGTGGTAYDPLAPVNVDKLNVAYMQRHVPVLTGHYVRVPIAAMHQHHVQHL